MIRPLIFGIAILIAGATQVTAQRVPSFKVANSKGLPVPVERVQFSTKLNYAE